MGINLCHIIMRAFSRKTLNLHVELVSDEVFGQKGREASKKEVDQLHCWSCYTPILIAETTPTERERRNKGKCSWMRNETELSREGYEIGF